MNVELSKFLLPPEAHHLTLMFPMIGALEFVFLAFAGIALVSTALSLAQQKANPELSRRLALAISGKVSPWLALGLLPLVTLPLLLGQLLYGTKFAILDSIVKLLPLAVFGFFALWMYRRCWCRIAGALGVLALAAFLLPFVSLLELIHWPERWPLVNPLLPNIYDVQAVVRILIFFAGAFLTTGAALLFRGFVWKESRMTEDATERGALRCWALSLTLLGALLLPALVVWDLVMLPVGAQTFGALKVAAPMLVVLWLAAVLVALMFMSGKIGSAALASVLAFSGLAFEVARQNVIQSAAIADKMALARMEAEARFAKVKLEQEAHYTSNVPLDPKAVEGIYKERCSSCHAFDHKVVGPAHKDVLPKYRGNADSLVAFILNPTKVDPSFPAMTAPGLSRREARAVADYLLKRLETETKGGATP